MIRSFRSKALRLYWLKADATKARPDLLSRVRTRLSALDVAATPDDLNVPGFDFHLLRGKPHRYSVHVNGPWCVTFAWNGTDAEAVDLENYH